MLRAAAVVVAAGSLALGLIAFAPPVGAATPGATRAQAQPDRCADRPGNQSRPCVGPVVDESGGGGDTLTIVVSVVVGLVVAGIAFVLLRRQLAAGGSHATADEQTRGRA
ncbi:MAG: hypothetical protein WEC34_02025 [Acidimicrobiia bacterium]